MNARRLLLLGLTLGGCGSTSSTLPPQDAGCDQACLDETAIFALRATMRLAYNQAVQAAPPGGQDAGAECLSGGAQVTGSAVPDGGTGAVGLDLAYDFRGCEGLFRDSTPGHAFDLTFTGVVTETGTLAVQSTSLMALSIQSDDITIRGTVGDPPIDYAAEGCALRLTQDSTDLLTGTLCGRRASHQY